MTEPTRIVLAKSWDLAGFDADAAAYIQRVEWADTTPLEPATRTAINAFVVGCKADGIWTAIKASCILAGARTLAGALVPLVGTAPTNVNFVSGDYGRKTGLVGDGSSKYLNSNRNNSADPQNSNHISAYVSTSTPSFLIGVSAAGDGMNTLGTTTRCRSPIAGEPGFTVSSGFNGFSRNSSTSYIRRSASSSATISSTSQAPFGGNVLIFQSQFAVYSIARIAFYSIGESLNLELLDTRVTALINAFGVAIP